MDLDVYNETVITTDRLSFEFLIAGWHWQFSRAVIGALHQIGADNRLGLDKLALTVWPVIERGDRRFEYRYKNVPIVFDVKTNRVVVDIAGR